ncbi:hypothetical protein D3C87_1780780 [compost metagenome]
MLTEKREGLEKLAQKLIEKEILFQADLEEILGKRPFDNRTTYDEFVNGTGDQKPAAEGLVHDGVSPADPATPINPAQTES